MPAKRFSELALWLTFQMDGDFLKLRFMESISRFLFGDSIYSLA